MKAMEVVGELSAIAAQTPADSSRWMAVQIASGVIMGLHMSGGLAGATDADGHFLVPETIQRRIDEIGDKPARDPTDPRE